MGKSHDLATIVKDGGTIDGRLTVEGATLGSTFENASYGNGVRVEQTSYTADNYVSLIEAPYVADYSSAGAHVRIGAKFNGSGSSLAMGTSNSYASGITNTALEIDNAGRVTMPYQPMMSATSQGAHTAYSDTAYIPSNVILNVGNHYNASTGVFTCPVAGYYEASFYSLINTPASNDYASFIWQKNSLDYGPNFHTGYSYSRAYEPLTGSFIISASASDTIRLAVTTANTAKVYTNYYNGMTIKLIG